jgi:LDH2 family malate/lactate/ureidoglycolate dehydrogenase
MDVSEMKRRIDTMIDRMKACRRREGVDEVLVPGEPEHRTATNNRRNGIPIGPETIAELRALAAEHSVPFALEPVGFGI